MSEVNIVDTLLNDGLNNDASYLIEDEANNTYTQLDENRNRNAAAEIIRKNQMQQSVNPNTTVDKITQEIDKKYAAKMEALQNKINELEANHKSIDATVSTMSDKVMADNIIGEEKELANDEIIAPYYDQKVTRETFLKNLKGDPNKGIAPKQLTPFEAWSVSSAYNLAKENKILKEKLERIESRKNMKFEEDIAPYTQIDESANVHDRKSAKAEAMRRAQILEG